MPSPAATPRLLLALLLPLAACATPGPAPQPGAPASASAQDRHFVTAAAANDLLLVQSSQLAADRARRPAVRAFARSMAQSHGDHLRKLTALAAARNIPAPTTLDPAGQRTLSALDTDRAGFDAAYVSTQQDAHRRALDLYGMEAAAGRDPDLKSLAQATLPELRDHLAAAERLRGGR